jgi:hypothetical protein
MNESSCHECEVEEKDIQVNQVEIDDGVSVGLSQPPNRSV